MTSSLKWVAILAALCLNGCGGRKPATSSGAATDGAPGPVGVGVGVFYGSITLGGDIVLDVACGPEYSNELRLTPSTGDGGTAEGYVPAVPVGVDCSFTARATEHRAAPLIDVSYSASLTTQFQPYCDHAQIVLGLHADDAAAATPPTTDPPATDPPMVEGLSASGNGASVFGSLLPQAQSILNYIPSAVIVLSAAVDYRGSQSLLYRWDDAGAGGTFIGLDLEHGQLTPWPRDVWRSLTGAIPITVWIPPPGMAGTVNLTLVVEKLGTPAPASGSKSLTVAATVDDSRVRIGFSGVLNHWPDVLGMRTMTDAQSAGGEVVTGRPVRVDAAVRDVDGDPPGASFTSDCPGAFVNGSASAPDGEQMTFLSVYFVPATTGSTQCRVTLTVDDGRGGKTSGFLDLQVLAEAPVAYAPIIDQADASPSTIGPNGEVQFEIDARSRYNGTLSYHIDLLSPVGLPQDLLPAGMVGLGGFVDPRTNETGHFTWRSPSTVEECVRAVSEINFGETFYFFVTVTDETAQSGGVPAVNIVVIPVIVQCAQQAAP